MAHSNSYRFTLILVGPVTTDAASFDHIGGLVLVESEMLRSQLLAGFSRDWITAGRSVYNNIGNIASASSLLVFMLPAIQPFYLGAN